MRVGWLCAQVVKLAFLTEWTLCGVVLQVTPSRSAGRAASYTQRRLLGAGEGSPYPAAGPFREANTGQAPRRPAGIPHMWSERQHNQRIHAHAHENNKQHDNPPSGPGAVGQEDPTGETHTVTFDHVQEGASHSGKPEVTRLKEQHRKEDPAARKLHRTGGINDILKRPGVDPEITGEANLNLLSVMRLAAMNLTQLIAADHDPAGTDANLTARQLRRKLRRRLSVTDTRQQLKHGRSRYSLVTTRVRTRAKRSDADLGDEYTWAVIVGGSGLAILIVVMCACVCARCNVDRKQTEALTPLPTDAPPTPAVFFVGGTHVGSGSGSTGSASGGAGPDAGVDNTGFALGDLPLGCGGAEGGHHHHPGCHMAGGNAPGPSTSTFGYTALKDDEDCVSLRSTTLDMEKS